MSLPVFGHHDAAQVGVTSEVHAEEVEDLTLIEISRRPDRSNAIERGVIACETHGDSQTALQGV